MHKLSIIIVNYNVKHFLQQAIQSAVRSAAGIDTEIIVVDNNSTDGSVDFIREYFPGVKIIANTENTGFSKANNQGIKIADGEYILLLNPDTVVQENTFSRCIGFMDVHPDAGALGVKMIDGTGHFLPESKRAFPSPEVAFYKAFGLAALFPRSRLFGKYHLGYLDENKIHEVDVLAGAFMMIRKSVLDKTGLLDETFFMYGEDIDLSYRIISEGYKNYYFPETEIIHYKGESTRKGSLNYVRMFYTAMKIFSEKHFSGRRAGIFSALINIAIYLRAGLALLSGLVKKLMLPFADAILIFAGMFLIKEYWEYYVKYIEGGQYPKAYLLFNVPLYTFIWIVSIFLSGGYDKNTNTIKIIRGIFIGTLVISAVYGFLPDTLRFSRGMIIAGAAWTAFILLVERFTLHFLQYKNLSFGKEHENRLLIVGDHAEATRVIQLLNKIHMGQNVLGYLQVKDVNREDEYELGPSARLPEFIKIYKADELIFCAKDIPAGDIMTWMTEFTDAMEYKIVPENSESIIGSNSKNTAGDLYTVDIKLQITSAPNKRNKRMTDIFCSLFLLITFPLQVFIIKNPGGLFANIFSVLFNKRSWVGYAPENDPDPSLPGIKKGVLNPLDGLSEKNIDQKTASRLNVLYARDYKPTDDILILFNGYKQLGRRPV